MTEIAVGFPRRQFGQNDFATGGLEIVDRAPIEEPLRHHDAIGR